MSQHRCPICGKSFVPEQTDAMPFCSRRCKQIDLGRWLNEEYGVPVDPEVEEEEDPQAQRAENDA